MKNGLWTTLERDPTGSTAALKVPGGMVIRTVSFMHGAVALVFVPDRVSDGTDMIDLGIAGWIDKKAVSDA